MTLPFTRRLFLGSACVPLLGAAAATPFTDGATLILGGPGGCPAAAWADWLLPGLGRALPPGTALRTSVVGGADGVTAANVFEARIVPDGSTALLLPGSAALAWLVGDPRARFDTAHWVPAMAGITPGLVVSSLPAARALGGAPIRLAASSADGPDLPAMLALDLLGADWSPVFGLADTAAADALLAGRVDAVCLRGRRVPELLQTLVAAGAQPLFSFGSVEEGGGRQRDPALGDVPAVSELLAGRAGDAALQRAWFAAAAASDLDIAMVLPAQTPAAIVALWRRAASQAAGAAQAQAMAMGVRPLAAPSAATTTAALAADPAAQLALRGWMAKRLDYRPA